VVLSCSGGIAEKRKQMALMVLSGTAMPEVSPGGGAVLCQGESGSGASLGAAIASLQSLTRRYMAFARWHGVQRRLLCAEQE